MKHALGHAPEHALITGIGGGGIGEQIIKCLYKKYLLFGTDQVACSHPMVHKVWQVPSARDNAYIDEINQICIGHKIDFIFPGSEPELAILSRERQNLKAKLMANDDAIISMCMNKIDTMEYLEKKDIFVKPYATLTDALKKRWQYPLVIKPYIGTGGSQHVYLVFTKEDLIGLSHYLSKFNRQFMVQEYIDGIDCEYTVGILNDENEKLMSSIVLKRDISSSLSSRIKIHYNGRPYVISSGITQGQFVRDKKISDYCIDVATKLHSRGPLNIQLRVESGQIFIFEINPRFSASCYMRSLAGINEPFLFSQGKKLEYEFMNYEEITVHRTLLEHRVEQV